VSHHHSEGYGIFVYMLFARAVGFCTWHLQPGCSNDMGYIKRCVVAALLLLPDRPLHVHLHVPPTAAADSEPAGSFYAAATTEAGEVYVWLVRPKGDTAVDAQQVARLAVDPQHKQQEAIFAAALEHTAVGETTDLAAAEASCMCCAGGSCSRVD